MAERFMDLTWPFDIRNDALLYTGLGSFLNECFTDTRYVQYQTTPWKTATGSPAVEGKSFNVKVNTDQVKNSDHRVLQQVDRFRSIKGTFVKLADASVLVPLRKRYMNEATSPSKLLILPHRVREDPYSWSKQWVSINCTGDRHHTDDEDDILSSKYFQKDCS